MSFDEFFLIQLWSKILKQQLGEHKSYKIFFLEKETKDLVDNLSFKLTDDQRKAAWEIIMDMKDGNLRYLILILDMIIILLHLVGVPKSLETKILVKIGKKHGKFQVGAN